MKIRFPGILGVFSVILMVVSFIIPVNIAVPSAVSADPGIMKWDTVSTPGSYPTQNDILNFHATGANTGQGSEVLDLAVGSDGTTLIAIVRTWSSATAKYYVNKIYRSANSGISFSGSRDSALRRNPVWAATGKNRNIFQVALAPDDPKFIVISTSQPAKTSTTWITGGPVCLWVSTDSGQNWDLAFDGNGNLGAYETIRDFDVSIDYGGKRDIGFVTVGGGATGVEGGRFVVRSSTGFTGWTAQLNANGTAADTLGAATASGIQYEAIKFSPTYNGDSSVALVYADDTTAVNGATYFQVALRDLNQNTTLQYAYGFPGIEVKNPASPAGNSPGASELNNVCLQLPSDFSGQSSSLRRAYVSLDAFTFKGVVPNTEDGIYRIDDTTTYVLMDTTSIANKSIYSIAYFGTYASGKLLAGERMGFPCTATVPTWFTDSPTTCPIPCWYPALKPTTGAANQGTCATGIQNGLGGAIVAWNADGSLGLVATGSLPNTVYDTNGAVPATASVFIANKAVEFYGVAFGHEAGFIVWWEQDTMCSPRDNDESALAISRNNGETWNQITLIDTTVDWLNDVAVAPDCTTIYLASVNRNRAVAGMCNEFDSVWRSTINPNVAAPLPATPPLGVYWERVFTHTTSGNCGVAQSDLPILRVVESCTDKKDGEIVGWAAEDAAAGISGTGGVLAWSPDFGDYWAVVTPR
ncbi:MAG: hypothetical protein NTZ34_03340, partial [Chloroflexi bacterium]|nr:hypothetical protein [Chloroflexota bacterium]